MGSVPQLLNKAYFCFTDAETMFSKLKCAIEHEISMSPELWAKLQQFGNVRQLKKNEYLLEAGQVCHYGYFVNSGSLVKTFLNQNGNEVVQGFYIDDAYAFMTEVTSYLSAHESAFQVKALENCELLEYSKTDLDYLLHAFPEWALFFHKITGMSFQHLYMFSAMRLSLSAEEFLRFLYDQHPIYLQRIPDKYIAQFMGISKEWLSKLKKKVLKNSSIPY